MFSKSLWESDVFKTAISDAAHFKEIKTSGFKDYTGSAYMVLLLLKGLHPMQLGMEHARMTRIVELTCLRCILSCMS